jgi:predicted dehydrogenase
MGIRVGMCGVGAFADCFIPLFRAHPLVEEVILCDLDAEKLRAKSERFGIRATCPSLDELCQLDVDAVAVITQHWMHAPQAVQALNAGKHVYSAVPAAYGLDELTELVRTVEETGHIYMIGETSYYYPCAVYCRQRYQAGDFGRIVYGEGEYYHDWDHGLYEVAKWRGGERWLEQAGGPPMYYPTHSTSLIISVTGAHMTHVSCLGFVDEHEDGIYRPGANVYGNVFSNESALFRMSDGSMCRINEFRRIGHPGTVRMSLHGTLGSYEEQANAQVWVTKNAQETTDLSALLACSGVPAGEVEGQMGKVTSADGTHSGASRVHDLARLPKEFIGLPNGHNGSHQFLVDDFVRACVEGTVPPNNVWQAARYMVPGLIAHESAKRGGELMEVPDFGEGQESGARSQESE